MLKVWWIFIILCKSDFQALIIQLYFLHIVIDTIRFIHVKNCIYFGFNGQFKY